MRHVTDHSERKMSTPEAADYVGLGKSTLDKLRVTGGGPRFASLGRRVLYDRSDLDEWVESRKRNNTAQPTQDY